MSIFDGSADQESDLYEPKGRIETVYGSHSPRGPREDVHRQAGDFYVGGGPITGSKINASDLAEEWRDRYNSALLENRALREKRDEALEENGYLRAQLSDCQNEVRELEAARLNAETRASEFANESSDLRDIINDLEIDRNLLQAEVDDLNFALETDEGIMDSQEAEIEAQEQEIEELRVYLEAVDGCIDVQEGSINELKNINQALGSQINDLWAQRDELAAQRDEAEGERDYWEERAKEAEAKLSHPSHYEVEVDNEDIEGLVHIAIQWFLDYYDRPLAEIVENVTFKT